MSIICLGGSTVTSPPSNLTTVQLDQIKEVTQPAQALHTHMLKSRPGLFPWERCCLQSLQVESRLANRENEVWQSAYCLPGRGKLGLTFGASRGPSGTGGTF